MNPLASFDLVTLQQSRLSFLSTLKNAKISKKTRQKFIENTYSKTSQLKDLIIRKNSSSLIEIDGGVNGNNARKLIDAGADALVAGNFVFSSPNPLQTIAELKAV